MQDSAVGGWGNSPSFEGRVNAHSGPSGQGPQGTLSFRRSFDAFTGSVTCLRVSGNRAVVGAVGQQADQAPVTALMTIVDGGATADDQVKPGIVGPGSTPPNCATATFGGETAVQFGQYLGELVVNDAPAPTR